MLEQTFVLNHCHSFQKCWYFDEYFQKIQILFRKWSFNMNSKFKNRHKHDFLFGLFFLCLWVCFAWLMLFIWVCVLMKKLIFWWTFSKSSRKFSENTLPQKFWMWKASKEGIHLKKLLGCLLYESPAETRLTVYRRLDIGKRKSRRPRTQILLTMKNMFSKVIALWKC